MFIIYIYIAYTHYIYINIYIYTYILTGILFNMDQDYAFRDVSQIRRVFAVLKFPYIFRHPQTGNVYVSEELFLFFLTRMSSCGATITSLIENGFGHDDPYWTRGFKIIVEDIDARWGWKVNGNCYGPNLNKHLTLTLINPDC